MYEQFSVDNTVRYHLHANMLLIIDLRSQVNLLSSCILARCCTSPTLLSLCDCDPSDALDSRSSTSASALTSYVLFSWRSHGLLLKVAFRPGDDSAVNVVFRPLLGLVKVRLSKGESPSVLGVLLEC